MPVLYAIIFYKRCYESCLLIVHHISLLGCVTSVPISRPGLAPKPKYLLQLYRLPHDTASIRSLTDTQWIEDCVSIEYKSND